MKIGNKKLDRPYGIAIDTSDMVYVSEEGNSRVSVFTSEGQFVTQFGRNGEGPGCFQSPRGLAVDNSGVVYVCDMDNNCVQLF
jgi:tripartite motif-containing protein 2/3/tripartite motif-containing protein 71